jgi:sulfur carrier protein
MSSLKIMVNGEPQVTEAETLEELCAALGYRDMKVATALNGGFVPAAQRGSTPLSFDDRVEIVAPRQGG